MFNSKVFQAATLPATRALNAGYQIVPAQESLLEGICRSFYPLPTQVIGNFSVESLTDHINTPVETGVSLYEGQQRNLVPLVAEKLMEHLTFARNIVQPKVKELAERVQARLDEQTAEGILNAKIVSEDLPDLVKNENLSVPIINWADSQIMESALIKTVTMPDYSQEELLTFIQTGNRSVDDNVGRVLLNNPGILSTIYNGLFQRKDFNNPNNVFSQITLRNVTPQESEAYLAVLCYLLADHFIRQIPNGIIGTLQDFTTLMTSIRGQAALRIKAILTGFNSAVNSGLMIRSIKGMTVVVNQELYHRFLNQGGSADAILGNTLLDKPYRTIAQITEHQRELEQEWSRYNRIITSKNSTTAIHHAHRVYQEEFTAMVSRELSQLEQIPENQSNPAVTAGLLDILNSIPGKTLLEDVEYVSTILVCRLRFPNTDVEGTLLGIQAAIEEDPDLDPKEAALISAIRYVSKWIAQQVDIVQVKP